MDKVSEKIKVKMNTLENLKRSLLDYNIDGYIIPKNDEYFQEYSNPNRLEKVSKFSGSAGLCVILKKKNLLFVDGRYTIQAKNETKNKFIILEISHQQIKKYTKNLSIGYDPKLFTSETLKRNFSECKLKPIHNNLVDLKTKNNGKMTMDKQFFHLKKNITGEGHESKIQKILKILKRKKIDNIFISAPENVAWLLNIRGRDIQYSPCPNCQIILTQEKKIFFLSDGKKHLNLKKSKIFKKIYFINKKKFLNVLSFLKGKNLQIDKSTCSIYFENLIKSKFKTIIDIDPCYLLKAVKNKTEIKNMQSAHFEDGLALTRFLFWIKNVKNLKDEIYLEKTLENFRKKSNNYLYPSFKTISASGPNGSIIHYNATSKSNKKIKKKSIYLFDSGGQYKYGTTDVTRTICFAKQNLKIKNIFTRVLKGHIAVVSSKFKKKFTGANLDNKARYWLKQVGLDYAHGTGHGVGFFLNVHEGPQSISKNNNVFFRAGMILSNEPGYYKKNSYGIRIENLIYVRKDKNYSFFENLTYVPIDLDMINFDLLNKSEENYINNYHSTIYLKYKNYLTSNEKRWLRKLF